MTANEIQNKFNLHYNNVLSNDVPGLTPYEISMFLTKAHKELVYSYYLGTQPGNTPFEVNAKVREILAPYIGYDVISVTESTTPTNFPRSSLHIYQFGVDSPILAKISEFADLDNNKSLRIKPITYDTYLRQLGNPFQKPSDLFVWRIDGAYESGDNVVTTKSITLVSKDILTRYNVTFLKNPEPIILADITATYEAPIEGLSTTNIPTYITPIMWDLIIDRAVELATRDYKANSLENQVSLNQRIQ